MLTAQGTSVRAVVDSAFANARCTPVDCLRADLHDDRGGDGARGLGVTILPARRARCERNRNCVVRPIDDAAFVRPIALIKKRGRTLPPLTERFVAALIEMPGEGAAGC